MLQKEYLRLLIHSGTHYHAIVHGGIEGYPETSKIFLSPACLDINTTLVMNSFLYINKGELVHTRWIYYFFMSNSSCIVVAFNHSTKTTPRNILSKKREPVILLVLEYCL